MAGRARIEPLKLATGGAGGRMADYYHRLSDIPWHDVSVGKLQLLSGQEGSVFWFKTSANQTC